MHRASRSVPLHRVGVFGTAHGTRTSNGGMYPARRASLGRLVAGPARHRGYRLTIVAARWCRTLADPGSTLPTTTRCRPARRSTTRPATPAAQRRNLTHVIRTINSHAGLRGKRPGGLRPEQRAVPRTIRISLYSLTDMAFARALVAASRRCISVQILMNNHLGRDTTRRRSVPAVLPRRRHATDDRRRAPQLRAPLQLRLPRRRRAALEVLPVRLRADRARRRSKIGEHRDGRLLEHDLQRRRRCSGTTSTPSAATRPCTASTSHVRPDAARPRRAAHVHFADGTTRPPSRR